MGESQYRYVERDFGRSITNFRKFVRFRRFDSDPPPGRPAARTHTHVPRTHLPLTYAARSLPLQLLLDDVLALGQAGPNRIRAAGGERGGDEPGH